MTPSQHREVMRQLEFSGQKLKEISGRNGLDIKSRVQALAALGAIELIKTILESGRDGECQK